MDPEEPGLPVAEASESVFRSVTEAEVSLDEMLSLACRQGKQDIVELLLESGANVNHRNKAGNTPLLEACSQGHVSIARLLLGRNANIDAPTETTHDSALTWACTLGNENIVALLLEKKANVEHRTKDGCTALMFAALAGHERVAKLLLDYKAEINVESDSNKDSPLTFACWKGHQKVVELFLERNADIEHRTKEGFSPLMFAALGGHTQVAERLLRHKAQVNNPSGSNNDIPLTSACWKGHHQVVELLLQHNSNIEHRTKDGCTPLMLAAREGHLTVAKLLLRHGAKVNVPSGSENNIPLTLACWKGHRDVVDLLLQHSSNIEHQNKAGCTPLMLAAREGHYEATQLLLDSGAEINVPSGSNDDTPLTLACWKGHENVVQLLVERNSNVNHQTKTGCTPLMEATREGHVGVAKLLLEAGADVETPDNYGQSPFFMACWKGHANVASLLLEYDANKDCRTKTGITPLFQACRENHVDVVKLLLDYGCNPSTPFPNSRECPLTLAAEKGHADLAQLLLSRNANIESRTKKSCTPFFLACKEGFKEIAVMLAKHGAETEATDQRGITPLLAAFRNGHTELVDWLLGHVTHLPSDVECQRALMAPMPPDTDLLPQRSKCLEMIMKAKKAREQAALRNAQSLFDELDAEREKQESKKKAAAKRRSKRKEKKKNKEQADKPEAAEEVDEQLSPPDDGENQEPPSPEPSPMETQPIDDKVSNPPVTDPASSKKRRSRRKRKKRKVGTDLDDNPPASPMEDSNDSADDLEFHDAQSELPDFNPPDPKAVCPALPPANKVAKPEKSEVVGKPSVEPLDKPVTQPPRPSAQLSTPLVEEPTVSLERSSRNKSSESKKPEKPAVKVRKSKTKAVPADISMTTTTKRIEVLPVEPPKSSPIGLAESSLTEKLGKRVSLGQKTPSENENTWKGGSVSMITAMERRPVETPPHIQEGKENVWSKVVSRQSQNRSSLTRGNKAHTISPPAPSSTPTTQTSSHSPGNQQASAPQATSFAPKARQEGWSSSQDSTSDWGSEEMDMEELQAIYGCSTDDDKIRSQILRAASDPGSPVPMSGGGAVTRPVATTAIPTPTATTMSSSSSLSNPWQEVTRSTTRTIQRTVSNAVIGRVIGRGGAKINSIQEISGAHIMVSRNVPKAVDRVITIRGTHRSILKAQELIDEALASPDVDAMGNPSPPLTRGASPEDSKLEVPLSAPPTSHHPASPSTSRLRKRHSDISLSTAAAQSKAPPTSSLPTSLLHPQPSSVAANHKGSVARIVPTTVSESSHYVPTDVTMSTRSVSCPGSDGDNRLKSVKPRAWKLPQDSGSVSPPITMTTMATVTKTAAPPIYSYAKSLSQGSETPPPLAPPSVTNPSPTALSPPVPENPSEQLMAAAVGPIAQRTHRLPSSPEPISSLPDTMDESVRTRKHSRSKSDSQVPIPETAVPSENPRSESSLSVQMPSRPSGNHTHFSPSMPTIDSPSVGERDKDLSLGTPLVRPGSSTLPIGAEKAAAALAAARSGTKNGPGLSPAVSGLQTSTVTTSGSPGMASEKLAVGGGFTKMGRNVAVILPTQQQQRHPSIPARSPPMPPGHNPTPDSYVGPVGGARRSSVPATTLAGPHDRFRKTSYAGIPWTPTQYCPVSIPVAPQFPQGTGHYDPFSPLGFQHAPGAQAWRAPGSLSSISEGDRSRSVSWAGQPGLGELSPYLPQVVYLAKGPPSSSSDPSPHLCSLDMPHGNHLPGESWSLSDKDFHPPAGVYGAIGSGVPSDHTTSSASHSRLNSSGGYGDPIFNPPPPPPPPPIPPHVSDVWSHSFPPPTSGPIYSQNQDQRLTASVGGTARAYQRIPPQQQPMAVARPFVGVSHSPSAPHVSPMQKHQMPPGHNLGSEGTRLDSLMDPDHHSRRSAAQKRWSVPSFIYTPQPVGTPAFQPTLPHHSEAPTWGNNSFVHGRHSVVEPRHRKLQAGVSFPFASSDPWSQWGGAELVDVPHSKQADFQAGSVGEKGKAVGEPWVDSRSADNTSGELQQLMKSLDISEHLHVLKDRKLSLQQLHCLSDEEWRGLKLPVGPRVKLMNAVLNIARSTGKPVANPSEGNTHEFSLPGAAVTSQPGDLYLQPSFP